MAVRDLAPADLSALARIDRRGGSRVLRSWLPAPEDEGRVGLGAEVDGRLAGFLFGEVRAVEFGSERTGWVFAVAVAPPHARRGIASALLAEACRRFRRAGAATVRTMVRRDDIALLSFFRSRGFVGGPYVQLELAGEGEP